MCKKLNNRSKIKTISLKDCLNDKPLYRNEDFDDISFQLLSPKELKAFDFANKFESYIAELSQDTLYLYNLKDYDYAFKLELEEKESTIKITIIRYIDCHDNSYELHGLDIDYLNVNTDLSSYIYIDKWIEYLKLIEAAKVYGEHITKERFDNILKKSLKDTLNANI